MKAIISTAYGPPENLKRSEVPVPTPKGHEVLVKVHATTINDFDWSLVWGKPGIYRLLFGLLKPKFPIPGIELSGIIEEIGVEVKKFKIGDAVYGDISDTGWGSWAEYTCVHEKCLVHKPGKMNHVDAAAIPHASMLAYQGLVDVGQIRKGQKILINGAGGGMGTFAVQIAKNYEAEVTGVDSGIKLDIMRSLGFDHVIDYQKEDFTELNEKYDLILDARTKHSPDAYLQVLNPGGKYVTVGGDLPKLLQLLIARKIWKKNVFMVGLKPNKDLALINEMYNAGKIRPVIDGPYSLDEIPRLVRYFGDAQHKGKIVVTIN